MWSVIVPVKPPRAGKSRLRGVLPDHERLAAALALDTVAAVLACRAVTAVVVVTDDRAIGEGVRALGGRVVPDPPAGGLNAAVRHGEATVGVDVPRAALAADLPSLLPDDLAAVLRGAAGYQRSFVPDVATTGTTLLAALAGTALDPRFGGGSASAHARSGAVPLPWAGASLRRDVDTPTDLAAAIGLGVGPRTAALL